VDLPQAHVSHRSPTRIRLKITSRRGDAPYFADLQQAFDSARLTESVAVNTLTGSVLFVGEAVDLDSISDFAQDRQLFKLRQSRPLSRPVARYVAEPLHQADGIIEGLTGGYLNLAGSIFLLLLGMGTYDLVRGGFRIPPWYTAFWYALGLFSLLAVEKAVTSSQES
jgi:hypothetical protein